MINFKRLALTDYKIAIPRSCKKKVLKEALEKSDVFAKFASSSWGKKLAKQQSKASQTDFDRYVALRERIVKSLKVRAAIIFVIGVLLLEGGSGGVGVGV